MTATKEQERKTLAQIKKMVADLGADSYIATAFEGCFEIAEKNIENDFACSMKQRAESTEKELESYKRLAERTTAEVDEKQAIIDDLKKHEITAGDFLRVQNLVIEKLDSIAGEMDKEATIIVERADDANSDEFHEAVKRHRSAKAEYEDYTKFQARMAQLAY